MDSTSSALVFTLYDLLANPRTWERLSKEVRSTFHSPHEITNISVSSLPYLDAVMHEGLYFRLVYLTLGLRFRSPARSIFPRITPPEGMTIAGRFVPGNVPAINTAI